MYDIYVHRMILITIEKYIKKETLLGIHYNCSLSFHDWCGLFAADISTINNNNNNKKRLQGIGRTNLYLLWLWCHNFLKTTFSVKMVIIQLMSSQIFRRPLLINLNLYLIHFPIKFYNDPLKVVNCFDFCLAFPEHIW